MPIAKWFNPILGSFVKKYYQKSIENILYKSLEIFDSNTLAEIKTKTDSFITNEGAFADRGGKSDLYYSLFGMFVWQLFNKDDRNWNFYGYIKNIGFSENFSMVHKYCLSIICSKLKIKNIDLKNLKKSIIENGDGADYYIFLGVLALYYQKDYFALYKLIRNIEFKSRVKDLPCSVLAANAIVSKLNRENTDGLSQELMNYYRNDGSFSALKNSPVGDLLSTAVALYALNFIDSDLRLIKPSCLEFIDSLYNNGSFTATRFDCDTDIEYTFYGLLALGSLA